jgi:hypothetical protein
VWSQYRADWLGRVPGRYLFAGFGVQSVSTRAGLDGATVALLAVAHAHAHAAAERARALGLDYRLLKGDSEDWDGLATGKGCSTSRKSRDGDSDKVRCPTSTRDRPNKVKCAANRPASPGSPPA